LAAGFFSADFVAAVFFAVVVFLVAMNALVGAGQCTSRQPEPVSPRR
jgi:hypothetical protein